MATAPASRRVRVQGPEGAAAVAAARFEALVDRWDVANPASELADLNVVAAAGQMVRVAAETVQLIAVAADAIRLTTGHHSPWRPETRPATVVEVTAVDRWVRLPSGLSLEPLYLGPALAADIAVGEAPPGVQLRLDARGIVRVTPTGPDDGWPVHIGELDHTITIRDGACVTAVRPRHGWMTEQTGTIVAAVVIAPLAWQACALARALLRVGPAGFGQVASIGGRALVLTEDGVRHPSPAWATS